MNIPYFLLFTLTKGIYRERIRDLANKESNRINEMQNVLSQIGIKTISSKDNLKSMVKGYLMLVIKKLMFLT